MVRRVSALSSISLRMFDVTEERRSLISEILLRKTSKSSAEGLVRDKGEFSCQPFSDNYVVPAHVFSPVFPLYRISGSKSQVSNP